MPHKFVVSERARLCSTERKQRLPAERILGDVGLKPGDSFVDIGAGTGFFALPAARLVGPSGRVFALDISADMVADLQAAAATEGLGNIKSSVSREVEDDLPPAAGYYFMANVFHELSDREAYLDRIRRRSGPGSRLVIIDYLKKKMKHGPPPSERVSPSEARRLLEAHGFEVLKEWRVNDEEYGLLAAPRA